MRKKKWGIGFLVAGMVIGSLYGRSTSKPDTQLLKLYISGDLIGNLAPCG